MPRYIVLIALISILLSCESVEEKEKRLAEQHCGSCHVFPEPQLLPKEIWANSVLPNMAFRMGLTDLMNAKKYIPEEDLVTVANTLPGTPMVSEEDWRAIVNYFNRNAPDELIIENNRNIDQLGRFEVSRYKNTKEPLPLVTLIKFDSINKRLLVGTRTSSLYILNNQFESEISNQLISPASHIALEQNNEMTMTLMGIMDPNDRPFGKLVSANQDGSIKKILIDSLQRPVHFEKADMNSDGLDDYVLCAFGNYTGGLLVYEQTHGSSFVKHTISALPGSRNTIVRDFNQDGKPDILSLLTQGNEQITLFINEDNFNFREKVLLRFPPVYGSSFFQVADFNRDGLFDLLYTNGDNSDLSLVLKPYHGVRIFTQAPNGTFNESWFYPMHGASQAFAHDYDLDGDLDIAAISFFSDFINHPEEGFLYFENTGQEFKPYKTPEAASGRWVVMEVADIEGDGDKDILLGALDFKSKVPTSLLQNWEKDQTSILILKNTTR
jgi:hypothetical protein